MWIPANAKFLKSYNKLNFKNALNVVPGSGTRNRGFFKAVSANRSSGQRMGANSTFGSVIKIGGRYIKKKMGIASRTSNTNSDLLKIFLNEIRVGSLPGVFPRIYAWKVNRDASGMIQSGEYIMDDFTVAPVGHKVFLVPDYLKKVLHGACPAQGHPIYAKIKEAVLKFWRLTKGYHGDLHLGNMAVMVNKRTGEPVKVIIFDYGSHKKFKANTSNSTCFEDFLRIIDKEYSNRYAKKTLNSRGYHPSMTRIRVAYPKRGQPLRPNTNLLRATSLGNKYLFSSAAKRNQRLAGALKKFGMQPGNKSLMQMMHPNNKRSNANLRAAKTPSNVFMTPSAFARAKANVTPKKKASSKTIKNLLKRVLRG
jgi:hypothetical protein